MKRLQLFGFVLLFAASALAQDSLNVSRVGELSYWDYSQDVAMQGTMAYVAAGSSGLRVVDLSVPSDPVEIGYCAVFDSLMAVAVAGDYAYVAGRFVGLHAIDISNPTAPTEVGCLITPATRTMSISGNLAYVLDDYPSDTVRVIDLSDPINPIQVGQYTSPISFAKIVAAAGNRACVVGWASDQFNSVLHVVDVSDPADPVETGHCDLSGLGWRMAVAGGYAYVTADQSHFYVVYIGDPGGPYIVGSLAVGLGSIAVAGQYAYASGNNSLLVIDISVPTNPIVVGSCDSLSWCLGLAIAGNNVAVAGRDNLRVVDVSNPTSPAQVGVTTSLPGGGALDVSVSNGYAYVAGGGGLQVIDISDPAAPVQLAVEPAARYARDLAIAGSYAYVAASSEGLVILDISNPSAPTPVGANDSLFWATCVAVQGNYAFLGDMIDGLHVFDVSNPAAPVRVALCLEEHNNIEGVFVSGNYAYVVMEYGSESFWTVDISNPASPMPLGTCQMWYAQDVVVRDNYAYVACGDAFRVVDISNPAAPVQVDSLITYWCCDVALDGDYAYLADTRYGIRVINVSNPTAVFETGFHDTPGYANGIASTGRYAYVADLTYFGIYDCSAALSSPPSFILSPLSFSLSAYPNPFNSVTTLQLDLPREVKVRLAVYDVLGREVTTLANGTMSAGSHRVAFDASGLTSGVYIVRLDAANASQVQKVMLVR